MEPPSQRRRTDSGCAAADRRLSSATQHSACRPSGGTVGRSGSPCSGQASGLPLVRRLFCAPSARRQDETASAFACRVVAPQLRDAEEALLQYPDDEAVREELQILREEFARLVDEVIAQPRPIPGGKCGEAGGGVSLPDKLVLKVFRDLVKQLVHGKEAGLELVPAPAALKRMVEQPRLLAHLYELGVSTQEWNRWWHKSETGKPTTLTHHKYGGLAILSHMLNTSLNTQATQLVTTFFECHKVRRIKLHARWSDVSEEERRAFDGFCDRVGGNINRSSKPAVTGDSYRRRDADGFPVAEGPCLVAASSRFDMGALACKVGIPELREGAVPHMRLDQLAFALYKIERRLLAWNMPAGVSVDNRRPFLRFRDKLRGELDAQVQAGSSPSTWPVAVSEYMDAAATPAVGA